MKNRSKYRRHQTAYEAPEVEGEFLNESADSILSVSDSMGNLTSRSGSDVDGMMLEEFNEDQGARYSRPLEKPDEAMKRAGASRNPGPNIANDDGAHGHGRTWLGSEATRPRSPKSTGFLNADLNLDSRKALATPRHSESRLMSKSYLAVFGALVAGFALAKVVGSVVAPRR